MPKPKKEIMRQSRAEKLKAGYVSVRHEIWVKPSYKKHAKECMAEAVSGIPQYSLQHKSKK